MTGFFLRKQPKLGKTKSQKSILRCERGYKRAVDKTWGRMAKNGFSGQKTLTSTMRKNATNYVLATTGKSCANKKVPFSQIDISLLASSDTEILSSGPNGNVVALGILVICPVDKIPDSKTKIDFW